MQLLEDHITSNIVKVRRHTPCQIIKAHKLLLAFKIGKDYYRQRVGIPQGSVLSSLLCSFFYGDLERNVLSFIGDAARPNALLRLIDDYMFITTDLEDARRFLEVMNQGAFDLGLGLKLKKGS